MFGARSAVRPTPSSPNSPCSRTTRWTFTSHHGTTSGCVPSFFLSPLSSLTPQTQVYYVARFTTAPKRGSTERTLHCVALNRSCFKIRGSRLSIPPARVLSLSGLGPDRTNWERTLQLRKEKKGAKWLKYGGALVAKKNGTLPVGTEPQGEEGWEVTGMEGYEERRLKGMEVVGRFGDVRGWKEL